MLDAYANDINIDAIAARAGATPIQGPVPGLFYLTHPEDRKRIGIAAGGILVLTRKQAIALAKDLPEIVKTYCEE
jgi:hypothetical protein